MATVNVGSGSGSLNINHSAFTINPGDTVVIAPGTYDNIDIDLQGTDGSPIIIMNGSTGTGLVTITGNMYFGWGGGPRNLKISGTGKVGLAHGFYFLGSSYRAIVIENNAASCRNLTFEYLKFEDIGDKVIDMRDYIPYDAGNEAETVHLNVKILHCYFIAAGSIYFPGYWNIQDDNADEGRCRNIEIAHCEWHECEAGVIASMDNTENYDIHDNILDSINQTFTSHPRMFELGGYGNFYRNKFTNHYGNAAQCLPLSHGTTRQNCYWYNNIVWNSKKYSAFEVQVFSESERIDGVNSVGVNLYLVNNTVGKMNTNNDWQGAVVDVYELSDSYLYIQNNLGYNNNHSAGDGIINGAGGDNDPGQTVMSNNAYYSTYTAAGLVDETDFVPGSGSPVIGAGLHIAYITDDHYGNARNNPPNIGAVESADEGGGEPEPPNTTYFDYFIPKVKIKKKAS